MERAVSALRDLTRRDILMRFYADPKPVTAEDVARSAGIHRSVAFDHLERLVGLGYLDTELRRGLVGKPAKLYRLAAGPVLISHPQRRFDGLARELAAALDSLGIAGFEAARRAGRAYGKELGASHSDELAEALGHIESLGADYEVEGNGEVVARNCVFLEACVNEGVVCEFHAGMLEGVLQASGLDREVTPAGRWGPFGCRYRTAVRARSAGEVQREAEQAAS